MNQLTDTQTKNSNFVKANLWDRSRLTCVPSLVKISWKLSEFSNFLSDVVTDRRSDRPSEWGCYLPNMYSFATGLKASGEAKNLSRQFFGQGTYFSFDITQFTIQIWHHPFLRVFKQNKVVLRSTHLSDQCSFLNQSVLPWSRLDWWNILETVCFLKKETYLAKSIWYSPQY